MRRHARQLAASEIEELARAVASNCSSAGRLGLGPFVTARGVLPLTLKTGAPFDGDTRRSPRSYGRISNLRDLRARSPGVRWCRAESSCESPRVLLWIAHDVRASAQGPGLPPRLKVRSALWIAICAESSGRGRHPPTPHPLCRTPRERGSDLGTERPSLRYRRTLANPHFRRRAVDLRGRKTGRTMITAATSSSRSSRSA